MLGDKETWTALWGGGGWEREESMAGEQALVFGAKSGKMNSVQVLSVHVLGYMCVRSLFVWILTCGSV